MPCRPSRAEIPRGANGRVIAWDVDGSGEYRTFDGVSTPRHEVDGLVPGLVRAYRIVPVDPGLDDDPRGVPVGLIVDAPSALFQGRVDREDFEARAAALAGDGAIDCGDVEVGAGAASGSDVGGDAESCADRALANGRPFRRTWTFLGGSPLSGTADRRRERPGTLRLRRPARRRPVPSSVYRRKPRHAKRPCPCPERC